MGRGGDGEMGRGGEGGKIRPCLPLPLSPPPLVSPSPCLPLPCLPLPLSPLLLRLHHHLDGFPPVHGSVPRWHAIEVNGEIEHGGRVKRACDDVGE